MKSLLILFITFLLNTYCYGTDVEPEPTFEEVLKVVKFIGIVKVISVPEEPKAGFTEQNPPYVNVSITMSFNGLVKGAELKLLWDSGIRLDKIMSYNSSMPIAKPNQIKIKLPSLEEEYIVFLEETDKGVCRDIYGWRKRKVTQILPANYKKDIGAWSWVVINPAPLVCIPREKSFYNKKKYLYESYPEGDFRVSEAISMFEVEANKEYWLLTYDTAVKFQFKSKKPNPDWPVKYVICEGDTITAISRKHYGHGDNWKSIFETNKKLIEDPQQLKSGIELISPPEK